jgi:hypothetical protein
MKTKLLREVYTRQEVELSEISRFSLKLSEDLENEKVTRNRLYQVR